MEKKDLKKDLKPHSEAKVRLLGEYLKRYLNIIANDGYTERIKIYDLFCGEGIYDNDKEGSPLIILRTIKDLYFANAAKVKRIPLIDCQFNDIDSDKVAKVKKAVDSKSLYYSQYGMINFTVGDYQIEVKKISNYLQKNAKKQKGFIFIDPYGYREIKAGGIKALLNAGNSEVLLFLPTQFMYRFDSKGTPIALIDFIEELSIEYKNWKITDSVWKFVEQLKEAFKEYLGSEYFVDNFTIEKDPQTLFCLFFFSSHIKGFEKMLEAKWEIDKEQGKGYSYDGNNPTLFFESRTNPLETKLIKYLKEGQRKNAEIYEFTLRCGFLPTHTNQILKNLQSTGDIVIVDQNGNNARKGAFYILYKYYKNEPDKLYFKIH